MACSDEAPRALDAPRTDGSATAATEAAPPPTATTPEPGTDGFLVPAEASRAGVATEPSDCVTASAGSAQDGLWVATLTDGSIEGITYDLGCIEQDEFVNDTPTTRTNAFAPDAAAYVAGSELTITEWVDTGLAGRPHWFAVNGGLITAIELFEQ